MAALRNVRAPILVVLFALGQLPVAANAAQPRAEPTFLLPFPWDHTYPITQRPGGAFSHTGKSAEAYDFGMPEGAPIAAAAAGEVVVAFDASSTGACDIKQWTRANRIAIRHDDGTDTLYMHLAPGSIVRRYGRVAAGEVIAAAGKTGFTCNANGSGPGAHLHLQRQRGTTAAQWFQSSIPIAFPGPQVRPQAPVPVTVRTPSPTPTQRSSPLPTAAQVAPTRTTTTAPPTRASQNPTTTPPPATPSNPSPPAATTTACAPSAQGITLYVETNFAGKCFTFSPGDYPDLAVFGLDSNVSSIADPGGAYHVTLFDQPGLKGTPGYYDNDTTSLSGYWNKRARSLRVERRVVATLTPTPTPVKTPSPTVAGTSNDVFGTVRVGTRLLAGVDVKLWTYPNGCPGTPTTFVATTTGADGSFRFASVGPGTFTLGIDSPPTGFWGTGSDCIKASTSANVLYVQHVIRVLSPTDGTALAGPEVALSWTSSDDTLMYEVQIKDKTGLSCAQVPFRGLWDRYTSESDGCHLLLIDVTATPSYSVRDAVAGHSYSVYVIGLSQRFSSRTEFLQSECSCVVGNNFFNTPTFTVR